MERSKVRRRPRQKIKGVSGKDKKKVDASSPPNEAISSRKVQDGPSKDHISSSVTSSSVQEAEDVQVAGSSSAAETATASSSPPKSASPEPNCAICLSKLENKSFTDSCFHMFCFVCLVEWSKVKPECPLCKQPFKSIVHNVRNYEDYEQYHIPNPESVARRSMHPMWSDIGGVRFRYRTTVTDHRYAHIAERLDQELSTRLFHRPSQREPHYRRRRQVANSDFRRSVYQQKLKLNSEVTTRRRVRETSPTFYRENSAQTHRLVPWLNRELNAILPGHGEQTAFVMELIMDLIKRFPINSEEFHQHVYPFLGRNTRQFMEEFLAFARSPYHMPAYDRHVTYEPSGEPSHDSDSDHDTTAITTDGDDSDVIVVSPSSSPVHQYPRFGILRPAPQNMLGYPPPYPSYLHTAPYYQRIGRFQGHEDLSTLRDDPSLPSMFRFTGLLGLTGDMEGTSRFGSRDDNNPRLPHPLAPSWGPFSTSISAPASPLVPQPGMSSDPTDPSSPGPSTSQGQAIMCPESDGESSSSDVMIVDYEKPWTERSPIRLSSGGEESDPDLVIVGMTHVNDPIKKERKKKRKHEKKDDHHRGQDRDEQTQEKRQRRDDESRSSHSAGYGSSRRSDDIPKLRLILRPSRSRSRSPRPRDYEALRLRLHGYKHKKFSYHSTDDCSDQQRTKKHDGRSKPHKPIHKTPSFSSTESEPETESRLSITARERCSSDRHSSIKILEYRKKSSKQKKSKKYKKDKDTHSSHKKKHKKDHKKRSDESSKPKKSKKKQRRDSNQVRIKDTDCQKEDGERIDISERGNTRDQEILRQYDGRSAPSVSDCTSDSEPDSEDDLVSTDSKRLPSVVDNEEEVDTIDKEADKMDKDKTMFGGLGLEFVELSSDQAAAIDEELENINDSIMQASQYGDLVFPNLPKQKTFKKHPHGHKSSKSSTGAAESPSNLMSVQGDVETTVQVARTAVPPNPAHVNLLTTKNKPDDGVQSSDITSSDIDVDKYLPSFLSFVDNTTDYNNLVNEQRKLLQSYTSLSQPRDFDPLQYPFTGKPSTSKSPGKSSSFVPQTATSCRQRTLSESSSDIDVTGIEHSEAAHPRRLSSDQFINVCAQDDTTVNTVSTVRRTEPGCSRIVDNEIDIVGVSDTESVVEYLGEEPASIDITGDSDSETNDNVLNESESDIDVVEQSDNEVTDKEKNKQNITSGSFSKSVLNKESEHSHDNTKNSYESMSNVNQHPHLFQQITNSAGNKQEECLKEQDDLSNGAKTTSLEQIGKPWVKCDGSNFDNLFLTDGNSTNEDSDENTITGDQSEGEPCGEEVALDSVDSNLDESRDEDDSNLNEGSDNQLNPGRIERGQSSSRMSDVGAAPQPAWANNSVFEPSSPLRFSRRSLNNSFSSSPGSSPHADGQQYISTYMFPQTPSPIYGPVSSESNISNNSMAPED